MPDLTPEEFLIQFGYPTGVAEKDMESSQQAAYWKHHSRKHEREKQVIQQQLAVGSTPPADYEDLKRDAAAYKKWQEENQSEQQKAIVEAERRGRDAAATELAGMGAEKLVGMALHFSLKDKFTPEEIKDIAGGLNPQAYLLNGELNVDKLSTFVGRLSGGTPPTTEQPKVEDSSNGSHVAGGNFQTGPGANGQGRTGDVTADPWAEGAARAKARADASISSVKIPGQVG